MMRDWTKYERARAMRSSGVTLKAIGKELGVSGSRVRQMLQRLERDARGMQGPAPQDLTWTLSTRARNCLLCMGLETPRAITDALRSGALADVPNLGKMTLREIQVWVESLPQND